ncbi:unnamed protein product [Caenorhabditis brenneri]
MLPTSAAPPIQHKSYPVIRVSGETYTLFNDKIVGKGAYSEVYEGRTESGRKVAVKTACKRVEINAIKREIEILEKLKKAQNIVQIIGSTFTLYTPGSVTPETVSFAMEYAKSSLEAEMKRPENHKGLPSNVLIDLVVDCSLALSALREHHIAHRDIKHMNILIFPGTPTRGRRSTHLFKLCDMGCSKELLEEKNEMRTLVGTPNLLHPALAKEMVSPLMDQNRHSWLTQTAYTTEQCDLWSLGCTLYFCATGKLPFEYDKNNRRIYHEAVNQLTAHPDAIAMLIKPKDQGTGYDFQQVTELPAKFTRYPKWLICTMTCLLRNFFHKPSIEYYLKVANSMRNGKRRTFLSIDQMCIVDHTDMSEVADSDFRVPSISSCLGYSENTDLLLLSTTSSKYVKSDVKSVDGLPDDEYLVVPQSKEVFIRKIIPRNMDYREKDDMNDRKLMEVRIRKCYDGLSILTETDEYRDLFDKAASILATQFTLLVEELGQFERVQTTSRFAVYVDMVSVPVMLFDEANPQAKTISDHCIQQAKQAREELDRHTKVAMSIESIAKQLSKESESLRLDDIDLPGIREEIESYYFHDKTAILQTHVYSQQLIQHCLNRRNHMMKQIFKPPESQSINRKSKLQQAMDLAASLNQLRSDYQRLQNTISECVDLLEKPFQEMKEIVNKHLLQKGHSRNSMDKSMHYLAPEFRESQHRMKRTTKSCKRLIEELNQEVEQLGFVRMGDTLVRAEARSYDGQPKEEKEDVVQLPVLKRSTEASPLEPNGCVSEYPSASISDESTLTPSSPKVESNYFHAAIQYFAKKPSPPT